MPATAWIHRTRAHAHAHGNVREHDGEHERPFLAKLSVFSGVSRLQRLLACARAWYQSSAISVTFRTLSRVSRGDLWKVPREGTFNSTVRPSKGRCTVRRMRPGPRGVRPGNRDALAISHRIGVVRCPLAGRKGNGVSYTLLQTRKSQKQRLQHNSASRAALSPHEWDARLLGAARLIAQHPSVRQPVPDGGSIG